MNRCSKCGDYTSFDNLICDDCKENNETAYWDEDDYYSGDNKCTKCGDWIPSDGSTICADCLYKL